MGDYNKYPEEHIDEDYCNTYAKNMMEFMDFKYTDCCEHNEKFHDEIVDAYCEHALEVVKEITKDSKKDLKIILRENKYLDDNDIRNISAEYRSAIENNEIPVILAKDVNYTVDTQEIQKGKKKKGKRKVRKMGQIDGMIIMPLEQMNGKKDKRNLKKSYCMLMEIKSSYMMDSKHHRQIRDASELCITPNLKDPYNILYVDGLLVTPHITERTYTHRI
ncbi:MAG: hypothetical protein KAU95_00780 [Candidatus Aenigmarchaeota archaeon]|nr:hypothetical protein [Candidatus Aenigmarchaeota archaeon]